MPSPARPNHRPVVVALPRGAVNFLGVGPNRAGLVGALGFPSMAAAVGWLVVRAFSVDEDATR